MNSRMNSRIKAMKWWNTSPQSFREEVLKRDLILSSRNVDSLTGREIEILYKRHKRYKKKKTLD